jgi:hypothetical protein
MPNPVHLRIVGHELYLQDVKSQNIFPNESTMVVFQFDTPLVLVQVRAKNHTMFE